MGSPRRHLARHRFRTPVVPCQGDARSELGRRRRRARGFRVFAQGSRRALRSAAGDRRVRRWGVRRGSRFRRLVGLALLRLDGVAKAALESLTRYLARDLGPKGIRVNLVAAGPVRTMAGRSIPGFERFEETWAARAPLGWDATDSNAVARACVALFSDWFPMTTGEILHVDGGAHAVGAP